MVQWVRLHAPTAGGPGLIPGWELDPACMPKLRSPPAVTKRSHMPQQRACVPQLGHGAAKINK